MTVRQLDCLGLTWLALCDYNPKAPSTAYFSIGDGVAALSLLLLIPQFMKPLYAFRLSMRRMKRSWLYLTATVSFILILIAALVPQLPFAGMPLVGWPVFWEALAGLGFLICYSALALSYLLPARVNEGSAERFARGAAQFLAHATPSDHVDFSNELRRNIEPLLHLAQSVNFTIANENAFYAFTHRRKIRAASYSDNLLGVLADPTFCRSLIERCPWDVADILHSISERNRSIPLRSASALVQQLVRQALIAENSIIAREMDYVGFARAPVLSQALFGNWKLCRETVPFQGLGYGDSSGGEGYVRRLNFATKITLKTLFDARGAWEATNIYNVAHHYEGIFLSASMRKTEGGSWRLSGAIGSGMREIIEQTRAYLASLPPKERARFYIAESAQGLHGGNVVDAVAKLTLEFWNSISNDFNGVSDPNWSSALETWNACFDRYGEQPIGMDPLQQRVALLIRKKIDQNMEGFYPALTRLCLSMLGPYTQQSKESPNSAWRLIERDIYFHLKKLPQLAKTSPDKLKHYLPPNVIFDVETETLTHTYTSGSSESTILAELEIAPVSLSAFSVGIPAAPPAE